MFKLIRYTHTLHKQVPSNVASNVLSQAKRSKRGNPLPVRSTYWYYVYSQLLTSNRCLFILQDNNMKASSLSTLKHKLDSKNWSMVHLRNGIFISAIKDHLRGSEASKMQLLPVGNCMLAFSNVAEEQDPLLLQNLASALKGTQADLIGGTLDGMLLTQETFGQVLAMPPLSVQRQMLLGLLESPARSLLTVLNHNQTQLTCILDQHSKQ